MLKELKFLKEKIRITYGSKEIYPTNECASKNWVEYATVRVKLRLLGGGKDKDCNDNRDI